MKTLKRKAIVAITFSLLCLICLNPSSYSAAQIDISGTWDGTIAVPGTELGITIEFDRMDDSTFSGAIDIPLQGAKDLPLDNIKVAGTTITFDLPGVPGGPQFNGTITEDGQEIAGDFSQGGATFPFHLQRKNAGTLAKEADELAAGLAEVRAFIDSTREIWRVPGLALAIVKDGEVIFSEGFGLRNIRDSLPVTKNTIFAIGSATKPFTTMTMAMLVSEGRLDWDEPVRTYLPTFKMFDDMATERMTPRDLVTHRSGLPRHDIMWYGSTFSRQELFDRLQYLEPNEDFRTTFQYQNLMFMTAGYLVGQLTDGTWEDVVRDRIFVPLGMANSNFSVEESQQSADFAVGYRETEDEQIVEMPFRNITTMGPAGSINSSIADMTRWVQFHLDAGKLGDSQLVSSALIAEMHTPQMVISEPAEFTERLQASYGLGWFIEAYRGHNRVHHGGNIDGFSALVSLLPQDRLGMVVLTNANATPLPSIVSLYATDVLLGLEPVEYHARIKARVDAAKAALAENKEEKEEMDRVAGTKPSHKLAEYAGEYTHPGYGIMHITAQGKTPAFAFNAFAGELEHWHYDVYRAHLPEFDDQTLTLQFMTNADGHVDRIVVPLEVNVAEITFTRRPSAAWSTPEYLAQFAGEFELAAQVVRFEIMGGDRLVAILPGQPVYDLVPYRADEYKIKDLTGFSVKFIFGKDGTVNEAYFKQPNGMFNAKRVMK
jgi:CubicO group peptidase (beta-lactamase class C family)